MNAWADRCPVCNRAIAAHNEATARHHYETWRRASQYGPLYWDETPPLVGEYDDVVRTVFHRASR